MSKHRRKSQPRPEQHVAETSLSPAQTEPRPVTQEELRAATQVFYDSGRSVNPGDRYHYTEEIASRRYGDRVFQKLPLDSDTYLMLDLSDPRVKEIWEGVGIFLKNQNK